MMASRPRCTSGRTMTVTVSYHRWVLHRNVPEYLLLGWIALPSLDGTSHGIYSAHCIWVCDCKMVEPCRTSPVFHEEGQ